MMTVSGLRSQDTSKVWIPRNDALKVLAKAEQAKIYEQQIAQYKKDIDTLNTGINLLQSIIDTLKSQKSNYEGLIYTYETRIGIMTQQRELYDNQLKNVTSLYKKERRKKKWIAFLGIITTGAAFYIGTTL